MRSVSCAAALLVLGCTNFDREDRVEDMRVLAVRTEPAEILYSPLHLVSPAERPPFFPLPTVDVQVEVFAFDPRGGRTSLSVQMCPEGAGDSTCRLYDPEEDINKEPERARDAVREVLTPRRVESTIGDDVTPVGRLLPAMFDYTFSPAVIDFFIRDDDDGNPIPSIFPLLPRFVVQAENLDQSAPEVVKERAFKRIPVVLDLTSPDLPPEVSADLARALGITLCDARIPDDEFIDQTRARCLERRQPNQNPPFTGFKIEPDPLALAEGVITDAPDLAAGALLAADPGAVIALTPTFLEGAVERYQVISFDIEASQLFILNRVEDLACTWYSTRGEISDTLTALQFGKSLGMTWTLPQSAATGERDSLYLVILDQRGGVAVGEITVVYR
jgi:hypothetical protein